MKQINKFFKSEYDLEAGLRSRAETEAEMEKEGLGLRGEKGIVRVHADDIEGYQKRAKLDREEKIRQALEGREGRAKFGARKEKHGKHQSTNKMNEKNKN